MNYKERAGCINGTVCMRVKEKFRTDKFKRNGVYPLEKQVVSISSYFIHFKIITNSYLLTINYFGS